MVSTALCVLKQQWREFGQVTPPDSEAVNAGSFHPGVVETLVLKPVTQLLVAFDQAIFAPATNPQQTQLVVGLAVQRRKLRHKIRV